MSISSKDFQFLLTKSDFKNDFPKVKYSVYLKTLCKPVMFYKFLGFFCLYVFSLCSQKINIKCLYVYSVLK